MRVTGNNARGTMTAEGSSADGEEQRHAAMSLKQWMSGDARGKLRLLPCSSSTLSFLPSCPTRKVGALIESGHRLVCGSRLDLHEECFGVCALRTQRFSLIDILPCLSSTEYIVYFLALEVSALCDRLFDSVNVRTTVTEETKTVWTVAHLQDVCAGWTEVHDDEDGWQQRVEHEDESTRELIQQQRTRADEATPARQTECSRSSCVLCIAWHRVSSAISPASLVVLCTPASVHRAGRRTLSDAPPSRSAAGFGAGGRIREEQRETRERGIIAHTAPRPPAPSFALSPALLSFSAARSFHRCACGAACVARSVHRGAPLCTQTTPFHTAVLSRSREPSS